MSEAKYVHLNRLRRKTLRAFADLSGVESALETLVADVTQENVNVVTNKINSLNASMDALRNNIEVLLKEIAGLDDGEVDAEATGNGFML